MAATIYGKGFIRLFAECVGLDPKPLVADYVRSVEGDTPSLLRGGDTDTLISTVEAITPELKTKQKLDVDTDTPEPAEAETVDVTAEVRQTGLTLQADSEQLVQAFLNLGINACEAMHYDGALHLTVGAEGGFCEVCLGDSGPGLDPDRIEDIFTPFVTTKQQGTGLGLPMVARIVHTHGGTVEPRNGPSGGAEFLLRLPLAELEIIPPAAQPTAVAADAVAAH